ncbi:hypothetical protein [Actinosynnema sp. NPDC020468]|uniref:hypothetical protein n=1 Tax=Actinosynnema sp. NPDC020468 TaxID=3154488 RepID=UPI0033CB0D97
MRRVSVILAATVITLLSVVVPTQAAALPPACSSPDTYKDQQPPYYTHWFIGEHTYGGGPVPVFTYRYWLTEDLTSSPPRFISTSYAVCASFSGTEYRIAPADDTFGQSCSASGDYSTVVAGRFIFHRLIGDRHSPPVRPPAVSHTYRFWAHEYDDRNQNNTVSRCV